MGSRLSITVAVAGLALALAPAATSTAADDVTLFARPLLAAPQGGVTLSGSIPGGRVGETIDIEARDCGQPTFQTAGGAHAGVSGEWQTEFFPGITTTLRAVWRGRVSRTITVSQKASVRLEPHPTAAKRFQVVVAAKTSFWRKHVLFQRLAGTWKTVRPVTLAESSARPGATYIWSSAEFRTTLPKGTRVRVLLPQAAASPCYRSAASRMLRVG
jgi:hypothetical protein